MILFVAAATATGRLDIDHRAVGVKLVMAASHQHILKHVPGTESAGLRGSDADAYSFGILLMTHPLELGPA